MYELRNLAIANWHNFDPQDIPFGRMTAIIGENKSGKSTLLDALQVALLGNHGGLVRLNKAANESKKQSSRTVKQYCLGTLQPGHPPLRPDATTWIVLHFREDQVNHDVSIAVCLEAVRNDTRKEKTNYLIASGLAVTKDDLVQTTVDDEGDDAEEILGWEAVTRRLQARAGDVQGAQITYPTEPEKFIGTYLRTMNAGGRVPQPRRFGNALTTALAFEDVPSDDRFFKDYLLVDHPIQIQELREAIRTYQNINDIIQGIRQEIEQLEDAHEVADRYRQIEADRIAEHWLAARGRRLKAVRALRTNRRLVRNNRARKTDLENEVSRQRERYKEVREKRDGIRDQISQSTDGQLRTINLQQQQWRDRRQQARDRLEQWFKLCRDAGAVARNGHLPPDSGFDTLIGRLTRLANETGSDLSRFPADAGRIAGVLADLPRLDNAADHLTTEAEEAQGEAQTARSHREGLEGQRERLRQGGAPISDQTSAFMADLADQGYSPRVLCSLVRVTDETWREAAEGLLGAEREALVLPAEEVDPAIRYWRNQGNRYRGCRIARTDKVNADDTEQTPGTMSAVVVSDEPLVMAFLNRRIGNVRLADDVGDLKRQGRAIMTDCFYDDGLGVRRLSARPPHILGQDVVDRAARDLDQQIADARETEESRRREARGLHGASQALRALADALADDERPGLKDLDDEIIKADDELTGLKEMEDRVRGEINPEWQQELTRLDEAMQALDKEITDNLTAIEDARNKADTAQKAIDGGEDYVGSTFHWSRMRQRFTEADRFVGDQPVAGVPDRSTLRQTFKDRLRRHKDEPISLAHAAETERDAKHRTLGQERDRFFDRLETYTRSHPDSEAATFRRSEHSIATIDDWIVARLRVLRESRLRDYETQMQDAAERLHKVFESSFVAEIRERIDIVNAELERMNAILRDRTFLQSERFRWKAKRNDEPGDIDYGPLFRLADAGGQDPRRLMQVFGAEQSGPDRDPLADDAETVRRMLTADTFDMSHIERYQNYWTFWLEMQDEITGRPVRYQDRKGIESGAEGQTPFYVVMGAALAAAYRGSRSGRTPSVGGLGLALFDEAFSKMDSSNQKKMLDYFRDIGLQPVIAAPMTGTASLRSRMDAVNEIWRNGNRAEIDWHAPGPALHEAIEREDPANLSRDDLERMAEARANGNGADPSPPQTASETASTAAGRVQEG